MRCFQLRKAGASFRQIAQQMGVSVDTAWADVNAELLELRQKTVQLAEDVRDMELQRCDEMLMGLWPKIRAGDARSVMAACKVLERRAKLLGLDAPVKLEHTAPPVDYRQLTDDDLRTVEALAEKASVKQIEAGEPSEETTH